MRATQVVVCFVSCLAVAAAVRAGGLAHNKNFIVSTADPQVAQDVLRRADEFREQLATRWFGQPLPAGAGRTIIHVEIVRDGRDQGITWPIDSAQRKLHKIWLVADYASATGSTLRHEILHTLFATRYPDGLPAWIDEGAASLCDDAQRFAIRRRIVGDFVRTGNWPSLRQVFNATSISKSNRAAYSASASVTQFLLTRSDRATFLRFAETGGRLGWDRALRQHYNLLDVAQLQQAWQWWAIRGRQVAAADR